MFLFLFLFVCLNVCFQTGFLCMVLAILKLALQIRAGLKLTDLSTSASRILALKACDTSTQWSQDLLCVLSLMHHLERYELEAVEPASTSVHWMRLKNTAHAHCSVKSTSISKSNTHSFIRNISGKCTDYMILFKVQMC